MDTFKIRFESCLLILSPLSLSTRGVIKVKVAEHMKKQPGMITVESGEVEERRKLVIKLVQAVMTHCSQSLFSQNHSLSYLRLKKPIPNPSDLHLCLV